MPVWQVALVLNLTLAVGLGLGYAAWVRRVEGLVRVFDAGRLEETVATALLRRHDGTIGGVFCLDILTGETLVIVARAVIMATDCNDCVNPNTTPCSSRRVAFVIRLVSAGLTKLPSDDTAVDTNSIGTE